MRSLAGGLGSRPRSSLADTAAAHGGIDVEILQVADLFRRPGVVVEEVVE